MHNKMLLYYACYFMHIKMLFILCMFNTLCTHLPVLTHIFLIPRIKLVHLLQGTKTSFNSSLTFYTWMLWASKYICVPLEWRHVCIARIFHKELPPPPPPPLQISPSNFLVPSSGFIAVATCTSIPPRIAYDQYLRSCQTSHCEMSLLVLNSHIFDHFLNIIICIYFPWNGLRKI